MSVHRRGFLRVACATGLASLIPGKGQARDEQMARVEAIDRAFAKPVLNREKLRQAVPIESMELLKNGKIFLVRVRSKDGAEGLSVANELRMVDSYPIFNNRVAPFFAGKDAREFEPLLWELYRYKDNYKYQGLPFWVCVAAAEFAVLDLLGKVFKQSVGELLGGVVRREFPVYRASGNRGNTPEAEVDFLRKLVEESGAKALKFRLGGRMSKDADSLPGRTERLIPLVREAFGPEMTLYADSNSSYSVAKAIEVGRLMEKSNYGFYEEPCEYDRLDETKQVADALTIPVAGGEQEYSDWRFRWMIANRAVDVVQPDLHYYGGMIRSLRVARMAEAAGMRCTPHMSGAGLGYLDVAHFVSCLTNPVEFHEFKGNTTIPVSSETSTLRCERGLVQVPSGPGFGITIDPDFVKQAQPIKPL